MPLVLQDFKLLDDERLGEILRQVPLPTGVTVHTVVRDRMSDQYLTGSVNQGVRVIDDDTGAELFRWTWWDERQRRNQETNNPCETLSSSASGETTLQAQPVDSSLRKVQD
jgi:hypothetical protein